LQRKDKGALDGMTAHSRVFGGGGVCRAEISGRGLFDLDRDQISAWRAYIEGLLTNVLSPKVSMFYLAVFPQFVQGSASPWAAAMGLITLLGLVNFLWFGSMVLVIASGRARGVPPRMSRAVQGAAGMFFIGFGILLGRLRAM
jgi:threonine/homoserine/homoserine lactone efflux protein